MKGIFRKKWLKLFKNSMIMIGSFLLLVGVQVLANNQATMNQTINNSSKSVDIVDGSGVTIASPAVAFGAVNYSFDNQDATGTLGTASQKIRVYNPTNATSLTVSLAGSATTAVWTDGSNTYDFNDGSGYTDGADTDSVGGQMTVDPSAGTLAGVSGCSTSSNISKGSSASFEEGTKPSIDLITSITSDSNKFCRWDLTGVALTQKIPANQASGGTYSITLVLSIT